ncbi:MAG: phosphohydrolase [Bacteroidetes bacterium]|nr:MAG: phosphohydrolase [Bacteroidota bacterium]
MTASRNKIINDPVYGFITIDHPLLLKIISHPYYQRLRRIYQMAFAHLVYPGAVHSRLHHSLGAYHLMCEAIAVLKNKGVRITAEEELATKIAILLHDIGHGPYSHALEHVLVENVRHEQISISIMQLLNEEFGGKLDMALEIFRNIYSKKFLYQLISGQLDVDRMDYLNRDSFFTGVSEGVIGYDRIIKMLTVHEGKLMVEEKAIYSIEKFLVARRLMYWQVYLHKTVVSAEKMLIKIIERAKFLLASGKEVRASSPILDFYLRYKTNSSEPYLEKFYLLDDYDVMSSVKNWIFDDDPVLSILCESLINRRLLKSHLQANPYDEMRVKELKQEVAERLNISEEDAAYLVFTGETSNTTYDPSDERIHILFKDGHVKDISEVDNALIHQALARPVKKFYICHYNEPGEG